VLFRICSGILALITLAIAANLCKEFHSIFGILSFSGSIQMGGGGGKNIIF
jgi:hypothetical protein